MNDSSLSKAENSQRLPSKVSQTPVHSNADEVEKIRQFLDEAACKLVPWWKDDNNFKDILKLQTEKNPKSYLDSFYLFSLTEISVNSDCEDIQKFINERFHNILASASHMGISIALVLSSRASKIEVYIGFKNEGTTENNLELFKSVVNGILPGQEIKYKETINFSSLAKGCRYGGMVTGIPILKEDEDKRKFNLSAVARSLYGKKYLLAIISRPISEMDKKKALAELFELQDNLHAIAKQTVSEERGTGSSFSETETSTKGTSKTRGHSAGATLGLGIPTPIGFIGGGGTYSNNWSDTESESTSKGWTETTSEQKSRALSFEKQNSYALYLEKITDLYIKRIRQGLSSGYWETAITFATQDEITSKILAGALVGELSKPNDELLPPPRIHLDKLEDTKTLFIPKISSSNTLFPKSLASYITSEELALVSSPPLESLPGYEIQKMPALALTDTVIDSGIKLGVIADHGTPISETYLYLSKNDINKHLFICGLTGSGKTTTVKHILKEVVRKEGIPFLVLESAKRDYRQLLADEVFKDNLNIFTIGDATVSPIRFNPFYIQEGIHPLVHIDYLKALFNASFSLYGPMPSIVEKCLHSIYIKKGWDLTLGLHRNFVDKNGNYNKKMYQSDEHYYCFPKLTDLINEVDHYVKSELDYKGELQDNIRTAIIVRLESLCVGAKGLMFNTYDFFPIDKLLSRNTIFEMESLVDDDDKAFFVGLMLILISEYRQKENPAVNPGMPNKGLRHFMVIEEAHRLLKNVETERTSEMLGNPKGKAVEVFCNILSEMRSLGQGVAVVEQIPTKISPDVIKNSNTKIVHRIVSKDDQSLLAGSLSIDESEALYLNRLRTGHALCHKEGMGRPVECVVLNDVNSFAISDYKVKQSILSLKYDNLHSYQAYQLDVCAGQAGKELIIKFFNSLVTVQSNVIDKLVTKAIGEMQRLSVLKDIPYQIDTKLFADYFALKIMEFLNKGIYYRKNPMPENLKTNLIGIVNNANHKSQEILIDVLSYLWTPIKPKDFIEDVIENLSIEYLYKTRLEYGPTEIKRVVSSYLLWEDADTTEKIANKIRCKMEGVYACGN